MASGDELRVLEVALDAMCDMQARFHGRYIMLSSAQRRAGGQGVVQFAQIAREQWQVRPGCGF